MNAAREMEIYNEPAARRLLDRYVTAPDLNRSNVVHVDRLTLPDGRILWAEDYPSLEAMGEMMRRRTIAEEP